MLLIFATALLVALAIDRWLGEPPVRFHPVVWMGHYLGWAGARIAPPAGSSPARSQGGRALCAGQGGARAAGGAGWGEGAERSAPLAPSGQDCKAFILGVLAWSVGAAIVFGAAWILQCACLSLLDPGPMPPAFSAGLTAVLLGLALKPLLAWAMLKSEVQAVEAALGQSLSAGRERLSWLVSRDVTNLTEAQVRESAIESLAENLNDSVIAPLFWFALLGLPGAALYRFANTADAMWGYPGDYKGRHWQWAGKWAARVDDALSWVPARITAGLLAWVARPEGRMPMARLRAEAARTPSPNSGWPMAAMALVLGVCLHKPGVYALNAAGRPPGAADTNQAINYAEKAVRVPVDAALLAIVFVVIEMIR